MGAQTCLRKLRSCGRSSNRTLRNWGCVSWLLGVLCFISFLGLIVGFLLALAPARLSAWAPSVDDNQQNWMGIGLSGVCLLFIVVIALVVTCAERCKTLEVTPFESHLADLKDNDMVELEDRAPNLPVS